MSGRLRCAEHIFPLVESRTTCLNRCSGCHIWMSFRTLLKSSERCWKISVILPRNVCCYCYTFGAWLQKKYYFQIIDLRFKYGNKSLDSLSPNFTFLVPLSICPYCCISSTYRAPAVIHHVVSEPSNGWVDGAYPSAGDSWCITSVVCKDICKETKNFVVSLCKGQVSVHITSIRSSGF